MNMYTPYQQYMMKQANTRLMREMAEGWVPDAKDLKRLQKLYKGYNEKTIKSLGHGASNQSDLIWSPNPKLHNLPDHGRAVRKVFRGTETIPDIVAHPDTGLVKHIQDMQAQGTGKSFAKVYDVDPLGIQYHEYIPGESLAKSRMRALGKMDDYERATKYYNARDRVADLQARSNVPAPKLRAAIKRFNKAEDAVDATGAKAEYIRHGVVGDYRQDLLPDAGERMMGISGGYRHNAARPLQQREDLARAQRKFPRLWDAFGTNVQVDARTGAHKIIDLSGDYNNQFVEELLPAWGGKRFSQLRHPSRAPRAFVDPVAENLRAQNAAHPRRPGGYPIPGQQPPKPKGVWDRFKRNLGF